MEENASKIIRGRSRSRSIYHLVAKDESDEDIECVTSSEKVAKLDGNFFEQFIALHSAAREAGQEAYQPIESESSNNNADIDFSVCRGLYKDIPNPTHKETEFFYSAMLIAINQRLGVPHEMKALPNIKLFQYAQEALSVKAMEHAALVDRVRNESPPPLVLLVDVISAKGLLPKDANGLSDPFCILGIVPLWKEYYDGKDGARSHLPTMKHDILVDHLSKDALVSTKVQEKTLTPTWKEQFRFDVGDVQNEQLQVEVWDHDEDSSVMQTMKNIGEVSNLKGMGRFFKEIAQSAKSSGKNLDDFQGWVTIPLNTISSTGLECSFPLQARSTKSKVEGELKLKLQLTLKTDTPKARADAMGAVHQYLWYNFAHYEVCDKAMSSCRWNGQLSAESTAILHQLAQQHELPEIYQLASQWIAYSQRCVLPHLDLNVMLSIVTGISNLWNQHALDSQMTEYLECSCRAFVDHSTRLLHKQHEAFPFKDTEAVLQLHLLIRCLHVIEQLSKKLGWDLFPKTVKEMATDAITQSTGDWFVKQNLMCEEVLESRKNILMQNGDDSDDDEEEETEESRKVKILVSLVENMIHHVKVQIRPPAMVYMKSLGVDFTKSVHMELAEKIMEETREVMGQCRKVSLEDSHQTAIALFSLYLAIKGFQAAGDREYRLDLKTQEFHTIFKKIVEQWFDLASRKAKARIQKAVEVDEVRLVDNMVKHSSSAVDVTTTFAQIKEFWSKLDWPDASGAYVFIAKVTDDIRQQAVEYANIVHKKLADNHFYDDEGRFDITDQLCIAINNIEQVRKYLSNLPAQLDFERVLDGVLIEYGSVGSEQCSQTLHTMLSSADEDMLNVVGRVVKHVGQKMAPDLQKYTEPLLTEPPEKSLDDVITPLMEYLDSNLITLHSCLLKANFNRILEELWLVVLRLLKEMVSSGLKTLNQHSEVGQRMHDAFQAVSSFFHAEGKGLSMKVIECPAFVETMGKLSKFGATTKRLIEDYLVARINAQRAANKTDEAPFGTLTVKCNYKQSQNKLRVRVMNASEIRPLDDNGLSDPYVIVYIQPHHAFPEVRFKKTQVVKKTLHPLFDESFEFIIPQRQMQAYGATIHFVLMDYDLLINDFGGEAFIDINDVPGVHGKLDKTLAEEKPVPLKLLQAVQKGEEAWTYVQTLKERTSDKQATEFLKLHRIK
ncbi:protein unc-13 homolog D-like [Diadema antillarum]|uniref:protein unc-13 homolog D-like n=1 Tax=Diadema antillarum TaxID=105358 RepID=UPI003A8962B6